MKDKNDTERVVDQIVIAEDSPTQAEQLRYLLEKHKFEVKVAKDGKEALNLITKHKPILVISDIVMPVMNGYELCKELKSDESTMDIPVILLTSLTSSEDVLEGISCGADNFITKPYREDYLIAHIEQILANRKIFKVERIRVGVEIIFEGKRRFITATQQQMLSLLISTYEAAVRRNNELVQSQEELKTLNEHLEDIVIERTAELSAEIAIRKSAEERILKLNRIYAVLSAINQAIVRIHNINQLFNTACLIAVQRGKFQSAWIGMVNYEINKIETSATAGLANDLTEMSLDQNPFTGVIKSGKHFISNNFTNDNSIPEIWKQNSLPFGYSSFAAFPLLVFGKAIGIFCIYSNELNFFDELEISLLDEMAKDISFALEYIQTESERKWAELLLLGKNKEIESQNEKLNQTNTELIKAKEHAEESDRLKSAFLANMSHEIRTPMNGILGFAELLKEPNLSGDEQQEYIKIIEKSGARMLNIINDIVDISKIEAGLMNVAIKDTNINEITEFIYTFLKPQAEEKGMQLIFRNYLTTKEGSINTDGEKVISIFTNLVKNAIKYTDEGAIEFGYIKKDDCIECYVKDTGIGIPKERQAAIFERFIQADIADKQARQGAGLGLSIAKAYVEMLGGKIWVESEPGKGSTFYFTLPYNIEVDEKNIIRKNVSVEEVTNQMKKLKILIAEDDETSKMLISISVKGYSKEIIEASTGIEAVEICRKNHDLDLILMDIQMPGMNGHEATRQIRQFNKEVAIIAHTAFGLSGDREKAIDAGCNDYITKPINRSELHAIIQKCLIIN